MVRPRTGSGPICMAVLMPKPATFSAQGTVPDCPPLREIIEAEVKPGPEVSSDEELIADIRERSSTVFHPTSTCMMGSDRSSAVVDNHCRVYGTRQLRVVDASIFPSVISGNTNAPVIMVAEKAADQILADREH